MPRPTRTPIAACSLVAALLLAPAAPAVAQDSPPGNAEPAAERIDPKARAILDKVGALYRAAGQLGVQVSSSVKAVHAGGAMEYACVYDALFQRPSRVAFRGRSGMVGGDVVCDGSSVFTYVPATNAYVQEEMPQRFDELMALVSNNLKMTGTPSGGMEAVALQALLGEDPVAALTEGGTAGSRVQVRYAGVRTVDGLKLHVIRIVEQQGHIDFLVEDGDTPWVRRVEPDLAKRPEGVSVKVTMSVRLDDWSTEPLEPARFEFRLPPDAARKATLAEAMGFEPEAESEPDPPPAEKATTATGGGG